MTALHLSRDERTAIIEGMLGNGRAAPGSAWIKLRCAFCPIVVGKEDSGRSFAYNRASSGYICFRCGVKGYLEGGTERFAHIPIGPTDTQLKALREPPLGYFPIWPGTPGFESPGAADARAHLEKRGIPKELWTRAQIGYSSVKWEITKDENGADKAKYNLAYGRVIVPFLGDGGWMGWSGRSVLKDAQKSDKYRLQKHPDFVFYNHEAIYETTSEPVYVVEGVMDALAYWPNAVAVCGDVTEHQLDVLALARRPVVFVPDGDAWEKGLARMCRLRLDDVVCGCVRLPPKKDPDEVDRYALWEAARASLGSSREVAL